MIAVWQEALLMDRRERRQSSGPEWQAKGLLHGPGPLGQFRHGGAHGSPTSVNSYVCIIAFVATLVNVRGQ
jgi:hypothetical protein